jgi:endonuclease/exonuclease/phosphatase family metal-dependent hydrolase
MFGSRIPLLVGFTLACAAACTSSEKTTQGDQDAGGEPADVIGGPPGVVTVMTWNICYGGSGSGGIPDMGSMFESVRETDFPERASRIARIIAQHQPQVVCLQEVARWNRDEIIGGDNDTIDFLDILLERLDDRGVQYEVSGNLETIDFKAPAFRGGGPAKVKWQERIVMLTRRSSQVRVLNVRQQHYDKLFTIKIPANDDLAFNRGWINADIACSGRKARYICTHLEAMSDSVRDAQARQLIDSLGNSNLPVIVMGDMNALPATSDYNRFINAGYTDAWAVNHGLFDGPTCCQDADLLNEESELATRIDHIFVRGDVSVIGSNRAGHRQEDRTPADGFWPSDHAAVVAKLRLE